MYAQSQTNNLLGSSQLLPMARRTTALAGRHHAVDLTERTIDVVALKVKEDFVHFLQHFREDRDYRMPSAVAGSSQPAHLSSSAFPTSDMLTSLDDASRPHLYADSSLSSPSSLTYYLQQAHGMVNDHGLTLYVNFVHLLRSNHVLANAIVDNFYRFEPFLRQAVRDVVASISPSYVRTTNNVDKDFWISFYNLNSAYRYWRCIFS